MIPFLFFAFAIVAIASAVMMIMHRNPIYCALFLILTLFALAGLYVLLSAPFIAAVHIIVYAGAIMVLFLFVIMLLDLKKDVGRDKPNRFLQIVGVLVVALLFIELGFFLAGERSAAAGVVDSGRLVGDTETIGTLLFTKYLLPFEIASVLLLSAIIGSIILAKLKLR